MVLVDSSVWIEASRRDGELSFKVGLEALLEEYEATLCSLVRLEVLGGARPDDRRRLDAAFAILPALPITDSTWNLGIQHSRKYRDAGLSIPWSDILVAALSIEHGCRVYAKDRHFEAMSRVLGVRLYAIGYGGSFVPEANR